MSREARRADPPASSQFVRLRRFEAEFAPPVLLAERLSAPRNEPRRTMLILHD